jgi:hypothetical protein
MTMNRLTLTLALVLGATAETGAQASLPAERLGALDAQLDAADAGRLPGQKKQ